MRLSSGRKKVFILKLTPIFTFKFNASNHLVDIKTAINPFDKCLIIVVTLLIGFLLLPQNINPYTNNYWVIAGLLLTFFTLIFWVFRKVYQSKVQDQLEELYEILDIYIEKKKNPLTNGPLAKQFLELLLTYWEYFFLL